MFWRGKSKPNCKINFLKNVNETSIDCLISNSNFKCWTFVNASSASALSSRISNYQVIANEPNNVSLFLLTHLQYHYHIRLIGFRISFDVVVLKCYNIVFYTDIALSNLIKWQPPSPHTRTPLMTNDTCEILAQPTEKVQ